MMRCVTAAKTFHRPEAPSAIPSSARQTEMPRPSAGSLVVLAGLIVAIGLGTKIAQAESGRVDQVVGGNLRVTFDSLGLPSLGYRPIRVQVAPLVPSAAPRVLTLQAVVKWSEFRPFEWVVTQPLELPPGASPVETTLSLPPGTIGNCLLEILEDGRPVQGLPPRPAVPLDIEIDAADVFPRVLAVSPAPPDFTELARTAAAGVDPIAMFSPRQGPGGLIGTRCFAWRARTQLPRRWVDHSSADLICITLDDLAALRAEDSGAFAALLDWTASGGNLVVSGVGGRQERLGLLESLLGMMPPPETKPKVEGKPPAEGRRAGRAGWLDPNPTLRNERLPAERLFPQNEAFIPGSMPEIQTMKGLTEAPADMPVPPESKAKPQAEAPPGTKAPNGKARWPGAAGGIASGRVGLPKAALSKPTAEDGLFWLRPYYWGMVVALGPEAMWPGTAIRWRWLLNSLGHDRWLWDRRHGVSVIEDNPEFWNFLIPGVGLPPVAGFEVLISVFVLAVGPVNYLLLRRAKRLHLMVVTVPGSAVLATGLLLLFGLVSDGLSTRVRVRSITHLDPQQGRALCWARLSYYAGVAPRGGLRFPSDTLVIPYDAEPRIVSNSAGRRQVFQWVGQEQWLRSGWLASRTPTQFVTLRTRPTTLGLEVVATASGTWEVRNRLGTRIHRLLVRNRQGEYLRAADIEPGGSRALEAVGKIAPLGEFAPPTLSGPTPTASGWSVRWRRRYRWPTTDALWEFESQSRTLRAESRLAGPLTQSPLWVSESKSPGLPPGSYAALVERSPEVELGTDMAREVDSFHLVLGKYSDSPLAESAPGPGATAPATSASFSGKSDAHKPDGPDKRD